MPTVAAGSPITLYAQYQDGTGQAVTPDTPLVSLLDPFGAEIIHDAVPDFTGSTGRYSYTYAVPTDGPIGSWTATWTGTVNGSGVEASEVFAVVEPGGIVFPDPTCTTVAPSPAQLWCAPPSPDESEDTNPAFEAWCCDVNLADPATMARATWAATVASSLLFRLSGCRFAGCVEADDYLCVHRGTCGCWMLGFGTGRDWRSFPIPSGDGQTWLNERCFCQDRCDCRGRSRITLPYGPVSAVTEVTLNGVALDPASYVLVEQRHLYFRDLHHRALAACFDPFADPAKGFRVRWTHGQPPPPEGIHAACVLTCELLKACLGQQCQLPRRVYNVARQGVTFTVLDPMEFLKDGKTGIYDVDLFLSVWGGFGTTVTWVEDAGTIDFRDRARQRW